MKKTATMADKSTPNVGPIEAAAERQRPSGGAESAYIHPALAELGKEIVKAEKQKIKLRKDGFVLAISVIVLTIIMEIVILSCFLIEEKTSIHVAIVVAPIIAFTAITIAVLVGVFRGFSKDDTSIVPWAEITQASTGG